MNGTSSGATQLLVTTDTNGVVTGPPQFFAANAGILSTQHVALDPPITTGTTTLLGGAGNLTGDPETYVYRISYVTAAGETWLSDPAILDETGPSAQSLILTNIPTGPHGVIARKIYRQSISTSLPVFDGELNDNTTTVFVDNVAEGSLGTNASPYNTSGVGLPINGAAWYQRQDFHGNNYCDLIWTNAAILMTFRNNDIFYFGTPSSNVTAISYQLASPDTNNIDARVTWQFTEEYGWRMRATNWWFEEPGTGASAGRPQYKMFENLRNGNWAIGNTNGGLTTYGTNVTLVSSNGVTVGGGMALTNGTLTSPAFVVSGTTNQVHFGATNTAPSGVSTPTKWISVQVQGESTVYRLPLYQ